MYYQTAQVRYPSIEHLEHPLININPVNPPYKPNIQLDPGIAPYIGLIAGLVAIDIQNNAEKSPTRTYYYNIVASNRFMNPEFDSIVLDAAKYVNYLLYAVKEPNLTYEQAAERAAAQITAMRVAKRFMEDPYLQEVLRSRIGQGTLDSYRKAVEGYEHLMQHFNAMYNQPGSGFQAGPPMYQNPQFGFQPQPGFPQQGFPQAGFPQQGFPQQPGMTPYPQQGFPQQPGMMPYPGQQPMYPQQGFPQAGFQQPQPFNPHGQYPQQGQFQPVYQTQPTFQPTQQPFQPYQPAPAQQGMATGIVGFEGMGRDYGSGREEPVQAQQPIQHGQHGHYDPNYGFHQEPEKQPQQPVEQVFYEASQPVVQQEIQHLIGQLLPLDNGVVEWHPSPDQAYRPAFNEKTHEAFLRMNESGAVVMVLKKKELDVNYEDHKTEEIMYYESLVRAAETKPTTVEAIEVALESDELDTDSTPVPTYDSETHVLVEELVQANSLSEARITHERERLDVLTRLGEVPQIFTSRANVLTIKTMMGSEAQALVKSLYNAGSFNVAHDILRLASVEGRPTVQAASFLNELVTKAINSYAKLELGLEHLAIDSFVADLEDLRAHMVKNYNKEYLEALESNAGRIIASVIRPADDETIRTYLDKVDPTTEEKSLEVRIKESGLLAICEQVTITTVNALPKHVGLTNTASGVPVAVIDSYQPFLASVISKVRQLVRGNETRIELCFKYEDDTARFSLHSAAMNDELDLVAAV